MKKKTNEDTLFENSLPRVIELVPGEYEIINNNYEQGYCEQLLHESDARFFEPPQGM